ncbi:MAG: hypothetical protein KDK53_15295 [Maritimibacter sp.]|nr:hypothetical protein [Maritimibacter sp.]
MEITTDPTMILRRVSLAFWHEAKARAAEVMEVARELAVHVRDWLDRAAERVLGPGQSELALAGGRDGRDQDPDRRELAARMREAWDAHQGREAGQETAAREPERETPQAFAARLREAATGIDREELADRAAALREGREAEERQVAEDAARERELERQKEIEREVDSIAERDRGPSHGL